MSGRRYQGYLWFWHVLSLGLLAWALGTALWDAYPVWGWRQAVLLGLVLSQMALYLRTFVCFPCWPLPWWWLTG